MIVKYPGTGGADDVLSFVGSHLDVVPANPEAWNVDPFSLTAGAYTRTLLSST